MQWYKGSIMEAIAEAKAKNVVFLVFVSGEDEESNKMNGTLTTPQVMSCMEQMQYVAVTLQSNSDVCQQFSQIYPVVVVPCVYFIGAGGIPLEIVAGHLSTEEFLNKIDKVKQMQNSPAGVKVPNYSASCGSSDASSSSKPEKIESNGVLPKDKTVIPTRRKDDSMTRLQFRFPDGSSVTQQFANDVTLAEVRHFVEGLEREHMSDFTLSTTFPRKEFSDIDYNCSLQELQLTPCAAILVIPIASALSARTPSIGIIWTVLAPIASLLSYLRNFLFGAGNPPTTSVANRQESSRRRNNINKGSRFSRQDGNVHRIANVDDDDDDDSNTWNGNSTQQM